MATLPRDHIRHWVGQSGRRYEVMPYALDSAVIAPPCVVLALKPEPHYGVPYIVHAMYFARGAKPAERLSFIARAKAREASELRVIADGDMAVLTDLGGKR